LKKTRKKRGEETLSFSIYLWRRRGDCLNRFRVSYSDPFFSQDLRFTDFEVEKKLVVSTNPTRNFV
jgi:hypothetical protein